MEERPTDFSLSPLFLFFTYRLLSLTLKVLVPLSLSRMQRRCSFFSEIPAPSPLLTAAVVVPLSLLSDFFFFPHPPLKIEVSLTLKGKQSLLFFFSMDSGGIRHQCRGRYPSSLSPLSPTSLLSLSLVFLTEHTHTPETHTHAHTHRAPPAPLAASTPIRRESTATPPLLFGRRTGKQCRPSSSCSVGSSSSRAALLRFWRIPEPNAAAVSQSAAPLSS